MTWKEHSATKPTSSVAGYKTVVLPTGKISPAAFPNRRMLTVSPELSLALGSVQNTRTPLCESVVTLMSSRHVTKLGGSVSREFVRDFRDCFLDHKIFGDSIGTSFKMYYNISGVQQEI